jgi:predicted small secreted protein
MKKTGTRSIITILISFLSLTLLSLSLSACNTMHGMGQDVQRGGEHMEDAATKVQNKM